MRAPIETLIRFWKERVNGKLISLLSATWLSGLAISTLSLWIFYQLAEEILTRESIALDTIILQSLYSLHSGLLNYIVLAITFLGEPGLLIFWCVLFGVFCLFEKRWRLALAIAVVGGGGIILNHQLKVFFSRARPEFWERIVEVNSYSFPSGHAMISLIVYGFLGYFLSKRFARQRNWITIAVILLVTAIGFSRLYLGVHWPTDVLAGYAAGSIWLFVCIFSFEVIEKFFLARNRSRNNILNNLEKETIDL